MMTEAELGDFIEKRFTSTLFRLETRDLYDVSAEDEDYRRYFAGQPGPTSTWPDVIRNEVARGLNTYRVHVVRSPLSDYLRYEFEWAYQANSAAGENIRILDVSEQRLPIEVPDEDFWLIGNDHLLLMNYSEEGVYLGAHVGEPELLPQYIAAREAAWSTAVNFNDYWRQHPNFHRDRRAA